MNIFVQNSLKIEAPVKIYNGQLKSVHRKTMNGGEKVYKLKGCLANAEDWSAIFSKIKNLKGTNLYLDKLHSREISSVLAEFRRKVLSERQANKNAYIKGITMFLGDKKFDAYSVLESRFLKTT